MDSVHRFFDACVRAFVVRGRKTVEKTRRGGSKRREREGVQVKQIVNSVDNGPLFDTNTNDPRYGTIIDKPIQRRRKIGEIEQNGCFAVGL